MSAKPDRTVHHSRSSSQNEDMSPISRCIGVRLCSGSSGTHTSPEGSLRRGDTSWFKIKNPTYSQGEGRRELMLRRRAAAAD
jgi:hypothetical protein